MAKPSWITLSSSSGSGNGSVTVTASGNGNTSSRSGSLSLAAGLKTATVSVSQSAATQINITASITERAATGITVKMTVPAGTSSGRPNADLKVTGRITISFSAARPSTTLSVEFLTTQSGYAKSTTAVIPVPSGSNYADAYIYSFGIVSFSGAGYTYTTSYL